MALFSGLCFCPVASHRQQLSFSSSSPAVSLLRRSTTRPASSLALGASRRGQAKLVEENRILRIRATLQEPLNEDFEQLTKTYEMERGRLQALVREKEGQVSAAEQALAISEDSREILNDAYRKLVDKKEALASFYFLEGLEAQQLNHTLGIFEKFEDILLSTTLPKHAQGTAVWEAILGVNDKLRKRVAGSLRISPSQKNLQRMALNICQIHSTLSQHVRDGGDLARLEAAPHDGTLYYQKHPLSSQQACVLECMAECCSYSVKESPCQKEVIGSSSPSEAA